MRGDQHPAGSAVDHGQADGAGGSDAVTVLAGHHLDIAAWTGECRSHNGSRRSGYSEIVDEGIEFGAAAELLVGTGSDPRRDGEFGEPRGRSTVQTDGEDRRQAVGVLDRQVLLGKAVEAVAEAITRTAAAALADLPMTGVAVLVVAVFTASVIDGAGNVPFLRSVRVWERPEMTGVFTTYRQMAQFAPPGFFAILLKMFELPAVFVASGIGMLILAGFTRYLPRRM